MSGQPWARHGALQGQMQPLQWGVESLVDPALGAGQGCPGGLLWGCGFAGLWRFPEEEAALGNHSVQSPASM